MPAPSSSRLAALALIAFAAAGCASRSVLGQAVVSHGGAGPLVAFGGYVHSRSPVGVTISTPRIVVFRRVRGGYDLAASFQTPTPWLDRGSIQAGVPPLVRVNGEWRGLDGRPYPALGQLQPLEATRAGYLTVALGPAARPTVAMRRADGSSPWEAPLAPPPSLCPGSVVAGIRTAVSPSGAIAAVAVTFFNRGAKAGEPCSGTVTQLVFFDVDSGRRREVVHRWDPSRVGTGTTMVTVRDDGSAVLVLTHGLPDRPLAHFTSLALVGGDGAVFEGPQLAFNTLRTFGVGPAIALFGVAETGKARGVRMISPAGTVLADLTGPPDVEAGMAGDRLILVRLDTQYRCLRVVEVGADAKPGREDCIDLFGALPH